MDNLKEIIESILFVAGDGISIFDLSEKLQIEDKIIKQTINEMIEERKTNNSGIWLIMYNNKVQLCSNPNFKETIAEVLNPIKEKMLTRAVLEVCAIIAYKQPITRLEIENIRGLNSDYAINCLIENNLIEVVGRKDAVGKPLLFGTNDNFLKKFNLTDIADLPDYDELLDRIKVLHSNDNNSLFDFREVKDEEEVQISEEEQNQILEAIKRDEKIESLEDKIEDYLDSIDKLLDDNLA